MFVLLAFLAGQVQYVYSSSFCTMKSSPVSSCCTEATTDNLNDGSFNECPGTVQPIPGEQTIKSNCMQVRIEQKLVVDNFTASQKFVAHFIGISPFGDQMLEINNEPSAFVSHVFNQTDSPPLDILTLSSNLRI